MQNLKHKMSCDLKKLGLNIKGEDLKNEKPLDVTIKLC